MPTLDFVFYGERPALDFANTLRRRRDPRTPEVDLLSQAGLSAWFEAARSRAAWAAELPPTVDRETPPPGPDEPLEQAHTLRELIITLAEASIGSSESAGASESAESTDSAPHLTPKPPGQHPTPACINAYANLTPLVMEADTAGSLLPTVTPEAILSYVAQDALRLFTSAARGRVKMCSHDRCGILFEDRSNGKRRQWCSMKECGNRVKVARHASNRSASAHS